MDTMAPSPTPTPDLSLSSASDLSSPSPRRDDIPGEDWSLFYPCSDGELVADNTEQLDWMMTIIQNLLYLLRNRVAFVAGNLMWYPVQNNNRFFLAPDVMVALTRPQRHRLSYIQSRENGVPPHVVFEIISPSNTKPEMDEKLKLYNLHGVQEYYLYDPDTARDADEIERELAGKRKIRRRLQGYLRQEGRLVEIPNMNGWVSPLLGIRFELDPITGLEIYHPNGRPFSKYTSVVVELDETTEELDETRGKLTETRGKLTETRGELTETRGKLTDTRGELTETRGELTDTREKLNETREKLSEIQTDRDIVAKRLNDVSAERDELAEKQTEMTKRLEAALAELEALRRGRQPATAPRTADSSLSSDADKAS